MANATYTGENEPAGVGPGCRWYQSSTGQWRTYNASTSQWVLSQDGFDSLKVADLAIGNSVTAGGNAGISGEFEGAFKKITIVNGIITDFELEE